MGKLEYKVMQYDECNGYSIDITLLVLGLETAHAAPYMQ